MCQAEDGIRDLVRARGLGDVYKRQDVISLEIQVQEKPRYGTHSFKGVKKSAHEDLNVIVSCLLYTSDAADERSSVDLGGRRINKKQKKEQKKKKKNAEHEHLE